MELIKLLTDQLGISSDQAKGGAGLLMKLAKDKLSGDEFGQVKNAVPEMDDLTSAAPSGGLGGMLGNVASSLTGGNSKLGALASLAGGFDKLGLDSDMIGKFVPIILSFVQSKGGDSVKNLLAGILK